jgi:hypothetical protein
MMNTTRWIGLYLALAALPVGTALFKIWVYQDNVRLGYALNYEEKRALQLKTQLYASDAQVAALRSPAMLVAKARALALVAPEPAQLTGTSRKTDHPVAMITPRGQGNAAR